MSEVTAVQVLTQDVLVACIMLGLTAVVGLLGNLMMLRALLSYPRLRTDFFLLLGSVSVADVLCLVVAVPSNIIFLTQVTEPVTDTWCKASKYLDVGSGFVAAYHLVVLAVLRGILLTSRGRNPPTPVQTLLCVAVLWIIALLAAIPFLMTVEDHHGYCRYTEDTDIEKDIWLLNSFSCFVPVLLILGIYLLAHLVGKRYFEDSYSYKEKQMSKLITFIIAIFALCQLPFRGLDLHIYYKEAEAAEQLFPDEDMLVSLYIARNYLLCLMMADKAARPVIYSKLAPQLAGAFDEVINCTLCQRAHTEGRTRNGNRALGVPGGAKSGRLTSTSSNAPLTGACEGEGLSDSGPDSPRVQPEELEIVQL